ncbi:superinfection immunity protein [Spongiimicrobium salis]|uniref:superinfection immunity protein n=1 Tax=Spongiimicrobium salis TaxID=1667022 RepID=UPI00374DF5C2
MTHSLYLVQSGEDIPAELEEFVSNLPIIILIVIVLFYFLPSIIALFRAKPNTIAIMALNLFLGCTLVGWVVALVWSLSANSKPVIVQQAPHKEKNADEFEKLARLKKLLDDGAITEQEYIIQKNKLLK